MNRVTMHNLTDEELISFARQKCCELCQGLLIAELANRLEKHTTFRNEEHVHVRQ